MITVTMLVPLAILLLSNYILAYDGEPRHYFDLEETEDYFSWFVDRYNKTYTKHETKMRFEIFKENLDTVNKKNYDLSSPVFGITQFSDLTVQEFLQKYTGHKLNDFPTLCDKKTDINVQMQGDVPDHFDWREHNVVTSVKIEHDCASSWAFSATGNVEGAYAKKNRKLVGLSAQQLVDCDDTSLGCFGGLVNTALESIIYLGGQEKEDDYKYTARQGMCKFDKSKVQVRLKSCSSYEIDEKKAKQLLFHNGPISTFVDSTNFQLYHSGILQNCQLTGLDQAVLIVGYGSDNGLDYWIVKNSWGEEFGEKGYIRLERGVNACGLAEYYFETVELAD